MAHHQKLHHFLDHRAFHIHHISEIDNGGDFIQHINLGSIHCFLRNAPGGVQHQVNFVPQTKGIYSGN